MDIYRLAAQYPPMVIDNVRKLAGRAARVSVRPEPVMRPDGSWAEGSKATARWLLGYAQAIGQDPDDALRQLARTLGRSRLRPALIREGWAIIADFPEEQNAFLVARSPDGAEWAIGLSEPADDERRAWLLGVMVSEQESVHQRHVQPAVVDPLATLNSRSLVAEIESMGLSRLTT